MDIKQNFQQLDDGLMLEKISRLNAVKVKQKEKEKPAKPVKKKIVSKTKIGKVPFKNKDEKLTDLYNVYKGYPIFLCLSGPSLATFDLPKIREAKTMSFGVNNSWSVWRPDFWTHADGPEKFLRSRWMDPSIIKFVPAPLRNGKLRTKLPSGEFEETKETPGDCPGIFYYTRNLYFNHQTYLTENSVNWGCGGKDRCSLGLKGARSCMLAAIRICYILGFRTIYLLGADFNMEEGKQNYAFKQHRHKGSVKGNNGTYNVLKKRFKACLPLFEKKGLKIFNCNLESKLNVFPFKSFDEAINDCKTFIPPSEDTFGWYDKEDQDVKKFHKDGRMRKKNA